MANLTSLMSGGWELDNELDPATDYELAMELWEREHPEEFRVYDLTDYKGGVKMENMFKYEIYCGDYSIDGYSENLAYSGTDREKALKAYREAKNWLGMVRVKLNVLGRENHLPRMVDFENDEFIDSSLDCYIFEDGSHGFMNPYSKTPDYDLDIFQEYAGHGKATFRYVGTAKGEDITGWVREFDAC